MAEPTLGLTFQDYILRVAEFLAVAGYGTDGTGIAAIPTDIHNLELCKRIVNDGWRKFYNSNPDWNWMRPTFTITFNADGTGSTNVDGDAWRHFMPDGFYGVMQGWFTYEADDVRKAIERTTEQRIRDLRAAQGTVTGDPSYFAIRPCNQSYPRKWEALFWPDPDSAETVTGACKIYPNQLIELTEKPNAGYVFDEAILAASLSEAERQRDDISGEKQAAWADAFTRAVTIDLRTAPPKLGDYGDKGHGGIAERRGWYTGVDQYTNLDGTVHTFT